MPAQHRRRRNRPSRTPLGQGNPWRLSRFALHGACDVHGCHGGRGQHSALYRCLARTADALACPIAPGQWGANRDRWTSVGERETPWLDLLAHAPCCDIAEMTHGDTSATGSLLQPQRGLGTPIFSAGIARCSLTRRHQETARPRPAQPGNLVSPDAEPVTGSTPEPGMGLERGPSTSAGHELVAGPKNL